MREKLVVIIGPTAVGKTALSIHLAKALGGEIISGDSMQVYRGMDIGTAKIKQEEQEGIPHHLVDCIEPYEDFSVSHFQQLATSLITEINQRGRLPILVGGTGLYVQSVTHQFQFGEDDGEQELREKWEALANQHGAYWLYEQLTQRDPDYAKQVHPHNVRRVIRALEKLEATGKPISQQETQWENPSSYQLVMVGLEMDRAVLYERINQRVDHMVVEGLFEEVQKLVAQGVPPHATSMQAIGYKEVIAYIQGEFSRDMAIERIKRNSRRYAKRQFTWFKRMKEIDWYDITDTGRWSELKEIITKNVAGKLS